jgi:hypothetical protein
MPLAGEIALLPRIKAFNENAIHEVDGLMRNPYLSALARKYEANLKKRDVDIEFNLFELISDNYYRETLHSDILKAFLDPNPTLARAPVVCWQSIPLYAESTTSLTGWPGLRLGTH